MTDRRAIAEREIAAVNAAIAAGYPASLMAGQHGTSATKAAANALKVDYSQLKNRIGTPLAPGRWFRDFGLQPNWSVNPPPKVETPFIPAPAVPIPPPPVPPAAAVEAQENPFSVEHKPQASFLSGHAFELISRPDNTFLFGAVGDLHAGSKYTRWDVREDLYRQFEAAGVQCVFDTGNWIDGEASFNRYDIEAHGLDAQCRLLADKHPRGLKTFSVWGDDHEGWYVQREGVDVGRYCAAIMQQAGHEWFDLGFMEALVQLKNVNTGAVAPMAVVHPGGGSAYALSYAIQKIVESYEGGEKPAVGLYGHYHKLWSGLIRNVWVLQTGCSQDQTPFMRKKRLEAHVGGMLVKLRQHPENGAILSMTVELFRYFNREWHAGAGRWSKHGPVQMLDRSISSIR